jgi:hypothetical protein
MFILKAAGVQIKLMELLLTRGAVIERHRGRMKGGSESSAVERSLATNSDEGYVSTR